MVFNGLQNSELTVYNALLELLGDQPQQWQPISYSDIARLVNCHVETVYNTMPRLIEWGLVARRGGGHGKRYEYRITEIEGEG